MSHKPKYSKQSPVHVAHESAKQQLLMLTFFHYIQTLQQQYEMLSYFDSLTHLANRAQFEENLKREAARAIRFNRKFALLNIDVDYFKKVNESYGHEVGDLLLKEVAARLRTAIRIEDFIARISGDEFSAILTEITNPHDAGIVAHRVTSAMKKPFELNGHLIMAGVSVGVACYPEAGRDAAELNKNADIALASAKALGRGNYQFFTMDMQAQHSHRLELEAELHFALERNEFFLEYQPRFDLQTQKMVGMEVLIRWQHPERGVVPPNDFISIAEETGLIIPIGRWVLVTACKQYAEWKQKYKKFDASIAINVSPRQFQQANFINHVMQAIEDSNISPNKLELEITESAVVGFLGRIENNLFQLRNIGVQFSIDDFGTGYSSLSRLKQLPVQAIKIDKSFVSDIGLKTADNVIIKSTLVLARDMGLNVIAEGVETESQLRFLENNQCPQAQGFYYCKPLSVEQMDAFIQTDLSESLIG